MRERFFFLEQHTLTSIFLRAAGDADVSRPSKTLKTLRNYYRIFNCSIFEADECTKTCLLPEERGNALKSMPCFAETMKSQEEPKAK